MFPSDHYFFTNITDGQLEEDVIKERKKGEQGMRGSKKGVTACSAGDRDERNMSAFFFQ
jgi:hypothetical protein